MFEASFYEKLNDNIVQCHLCPNHCVINTLERGECGVRENRYGRLFSKVYGKIAAIGVDPIEKKPLFHFYPGKAALSIATVGCNLRCMFCQNYELSQGVKLSNEVYGEALSPESVVKICKDKNLKIIAYTYSEPTIAFEYYLEIMKLAKKYSIKNVFITNGYINPEPLKVLSEYLDAVNVDLKSFSDDFYKKLTGGRLKPVLEAIKLYHKLGVWIEITTLVIPGKNEDDLEEIAKFIAGISKNIPWHISRFYPHFMMKDTPETPFDLLKKAYDFGKDYGLKYVYIGNVLSEYENTLCPSCNNVVIERIGFEVKNFLKDDKCPFCGKKIDGIFD